MSFKIGMIKLAVNWTPKALILWVANIKLKGVTKLTDFVLDLDARKAYVQAQLVGEPEMIEVLAEGFAVVREGDSYNLIVQQIRSNRIWLNNFFSRITGRAWKIPAIPRAAPYLNLLAELFKP